MVSLSVQHETFPTKGAFRISRGARTEINVVTVTLSDGAALGRAECVPYQRYGESVESVMDQIMGLEGEVARGLDRLALQTALPNGAARNGLDCAFWDLEAKRSGQPVWQLAGLPEPKPIITAFTLSLDSVEAMGENAKANAHRPLLKLKLAGPEDLDRVKAVRANAPESRLIVDANEGWTVEQYQAIAPELVALGVEMIEQPLPAGEDAGLGEIDRPVALCADESCHDRKSLDALKGKYDFINIKIDKTGGLTEALALKAEAEAAGFRIMVGCMLGTSLAMAPATYVAQGAEIADLDGPLLIAEDRSPGLVFEGSTIRPPAAALWG